MKGLILTVILVTLSTVSFAKNYDCTYENGQSGKVFISSSKTTATVKLEGPVNEVYKNCKAGRDDFGLLIDCSNNIIDFMILLNDEISPATGGIMSSTHDLFLDLDC